MMTWMLKPHGVETVSVKNSTEALELLEVDTEFDGAVCDLMLQGSAMSGNDLAEEILTKGIFPVVVVTAAPYALERHPVPDHIPVLEKPFGAEDLRGVFGV